MLSKEIEERNDELFDELVSVEGKCESVRGELLRAANRIAYRFFNDGDRIGIGYGNETCNAAARYIAKEGTWEMQDIVLRRLWGEWNEDKYEMFVDRLMEIVLDYVSDYSNKSLDRETYDMFDLREDRDDSYEDDWEE